MDKLNTIPTSPSTRNGWGEGIPVTDPGPTSAKIAAYEDEIPLLVCNIRHAVEGLFVFPQVIDQFELRKSLVLRESEANDIPFQFDAVIERGGLVEPIPDGVYEVNEAMKRDTLHVMRTHTCNLGGLIADELAATLPGCRAFITDPDVMGELEEAVRTTGSLSMSRIIIWHTLNQKAIVRHYAAERGTRYEDLDLTVCHLGGGIFVAVHRYGRAVDTDNAPDGEGLFSPERVGTLSAGQLIDPCFNGKFTEDELKKRISGRAELTAHLGTTDIPAVIQSIEAGDDHTRLVFGAMIYNVAKSIGAASIVLCGKVDAILLIEGIAYSSYVIFRLRGRISFLIPVFVYPREDRMEALTLNTLGTLKGEPPVQVYQ